MFGWFKKKKIEDEVEEELPMKHYERTCVTCKWMIIREDRSDKAQQCRSPNRRKFNYGNVVDGDKIKHANYLSCREERDSSQWAIFASCGEEGKLWEKKED